MWYNWNRKIFKVNDIIWTKEMIADAWKDLIQVFINSNVLNTMTEKPPLIGTSDWELLQWWYVNQHIFDISKLREDRIKND